MGPSLLSSRTFRFSLFPPGFLDFLLKMIYSKVLEGEILKLDVNWIFFNVKKYSTSYGASKLPYGRFMLLHKINCVVFRI